MSEGGAVSFADRVGRWAVESSLESGMWVRETLGAGLEEPQGWRGKMGLKKRRFRCGAAEQNPWVFSGSA